MKAWSFRSPTPEWTLELATELGRAIGERGLAIGLIGPLGAGKTLFVKGLAAGLGVDSRLVSSPTFVIAQQYPLDRGPRLLQHVDLYRLESEAELDSIGFEEALAPGVVLVTEWADRFPGVLGEARLEIELVPTARRRSGLASPRRGEARAYGAEAERVLADWVERAADLDRKTPGTSGTSDGSGASDPAATARAGGGAAGRATDPEMRRLAVWLLVLALAALARTAGSASADAPVPACRAPRVLESDALGVRRVSCAGRAMDGVPGTNDGVAHTGGGTGGGLGGLLFGEPIDLNRASLPLLEALPGIGPARAQAIVAERARGRFDGVVELERVQGIGPVTRERLARWLRVAAPSDARPARGSVRRERRG